MGTRCAFVQMSLQAGGGIWGVGETGGREAKGHNRGRLH